MHVNSTQFVSKLSKPDWSELVVLLLTPVKLSVILGPTPSIKDWGQQIVCLQLLAIVRRPLWYDEGKECTNCSGLESGWRS